ncbi:MAG: S-layer homology domain-containing protein [Defluviitaleaceae bacterium]|nr:S-layer homology domain-containing protein [Defluviitaleaceae bacterium]MCL2263446.1 S-layer homology domain-containing protein [Defluviitaleaceae bacterium]
MHKRVISFLLAVTLVMSLFGFSLTVSAAEDFARYLGDGAGVEFSISGVANPGIPVDVELRRGSITGDVVSWMPFPNVGGTVSGTIESGVLTDANYFIVPSRGEAEPVVTAADEYAVTFTAGDGGSIAATVGGEAITSGAEFPVGTSVVFTATPDEGYVVESWTVTGGAAEAGTPASITRVVAAGGLTVAVAFEEGEEEEPGATVEVSVDYATIPQGVNRVGRTFVAIVSGDDITSSNVTWSVDAPSGVSYAAFTPRNTAEGGEAVILFTVGANATGTITVTATHEESGATGSANVGIVRQRVSGDARPEAPPRHGGILPYGIPIEPGHRVDAPPPIPVGPQPPEPFWGIDEMTQAFLLFNDVPMNAWFHDFVTVVHHHGLMHGVGYRTFAPEAPMTRAMFIQVIANLEGVNLGAFAAGSPAFNDVAQGAWYYPAIQWANSEGITFGVGEGYFAPNVNVTREQMAALLNRYATHRNITLPVRGTTPFTDAGAVSYWAVTDVAAIQAAGIIGGFPDGSFAPQQTATRAQVATIFAMFLQATGRA